MTSLDHLADLLADHDGDDRCGCLAEAIWELASGCDPDNQRTIQRISSCLANHPAGHTLRTRIPDTPGQTPCPHGDPRGPHYCANCRHP